MLVPGAFGLIGHGQLALQHRLQAGGQVGALADLLQQCLGRCRVTCVAQCQCVVELGAGLVGVQQQRALKRLNGSGGLPD